MKQIVIPIIALLIVLFHDSSAFQPTPLSRRESLLPTPEQNILYQSASEESTSADKPYFLREAVMTDLSDAANVLADGFYYENNPASKWWEKIQTQLSLESNLPNSFLGVQHQMWVACENESGRVLAFCEVDNRPQQNREGSSTEVRPYMCNLAVDTKWRKQGVAQDMIRRCEESVKEWEEKTLYLKVKENNEAAVGLYEKMGYEVSSNEITKKTEDVLLTMKRTWTADEDESDQMATELVTNTVAE
mmetsp:Transcript_635/g.1004  ORF Transcript_635/g.1004 Transcript_635/m.1004 type:complete len:247 (+) Transcript_635:192-932(+)|eukprot:CAMPEP_0194226574 /NCGR_PEP_ID=MMETSP0156-20130528/42136_1 /TAXON_ID=33649 /ORGANISM="Thalassionema nitzschioides, Strain L26-B" /LENGTH=246 /DNA_ID=CAMNT_0038958969 /DNA_START=97 /DNA_END=837 /DNA_ORIENTATION=-